MRIFPDEFIHLGADEVRPQCWKEDSELMAWAPAHGISGGTTGIFDFFEEKVLSIAKELGRRPVLWEGAMDANLKSPQQSESGAVIEPWKCWSGLNTRSAATAAKH